MSAPTKSPIHPEQQDERSVRVFVSSTFQDMHPERDTLSRHAFPAIRRFCESRGWAWHEVDLRWGIPSERKPAEPTLHLCLQEIDRCRPFFIGLIGDRYGWIPEIDSLLRELYPWLGKFPGRSVTELEIRYGALEVPAKTHAFFYFRRSASLVADKVDGGGSDDGQQQLMRLKADIRASGFPVKEYRDPTHLATLVREDFLAIIGDLCPSEEALEWLDREWQEHTRMASLRARLALRRDRLFRQLDDYLKGGGPPLLVHGETGVGKSTLLADWIASHNYPRRESLDEPSALGRLASLLPFLRSKDPPHRRVWVFHLVGATPSSTRLANLLTRIAEELRRGHNLSYHIPTSIRDLRAAFPQWLGNAADGGTTVIVIDGLDQLEHENVDEVLTWLPRTIPAQVRLIVSVSTRTAIQGFANHGWGEVVALPWELGERQAFVARYLTAYGKRLDPDVYQVVVEAKGAAYPLYLRLFLDELRLLGSRTRVREAGPHYAQCIGSSDLYEAILNRFEQDYESQRPGLVGDAVRYIWASRDGLEEFELLDLLGKGAPLAQVVWSPLALAFHESLMARSGRVGFFHEGLRQAVEAKYLTQPTAQTQTHNELSHYFNSVRASEEAPSYRVLDELPWQLARTHHWSNLARLLSEPVFFLELWKRDSACIAPYWHKIESATDLRLADSCDKFDLGTAIHRRAAWNAMLLLEQTGYVMPAVELGHRLAAALRANSEESALRVLLINQAIMMRGAGLLAQADRVLSVLEQSCRENEDSHLLQVCLANRGIVLRELGHFDKALAMHREEEAICNSEENAYGVAVSQQNQALALLQQGEFKRALTLLRTCEDFFRRRGDLLAQQASLGNMGTAYHRLGKPARALKAYVKEESLCRQIAARRELQACLGRKAAVLQELGDDDGASSTLDEQETICRALQDPESLASYLLTRAAFWHNVGPAGRDRAQRCLSEAIEITNKHLMHGYREQAHQMQQDLS